MLISLSDIIAVAPLANLPRHKSTLIRRLSEAGATPHRDRVKGGQLGFAFDLDTLPSELRAVLPALEQASEAPTFRRYLLAPPSQRDEADKRLTIAHHIADLIKGGASKVAAYAEAGQEFGVSSTTARTIWRTVEQLPQPDWLAALVKDYKGREPEPINKEILDYFFADYGRVEKPQARACYERTRRAAEKNGWGPVPSEKTLLRRWNALPAEVRILWREGKKALANAYPAAERDRTGMMPLDSINMDSRTWDLRVIWSDGRVIRPTITLAQDEATNFLLAYEVTETESSVSYRRVLCDVFITYGIAKQARFDNTLAAANKALTAGAKSRFRFTSNPDDIEGLLPRVGCVPRFTKPANGRAKLVERAFAELKERSEKHPVLAGAYTGRSPSEKPANYGARAVPLDVFKSILKEAVDHYNTRTDRRGKAAYKTSHQVIFEKGLQDVAVRKFTEEQRRFFFADAVKRTVSPSGFITLGKQPHTNRYYADELLAFAGQEVVVRFDPEDATAPVMAETLNGRTIATDIALIEKRGFNSQADAAEHARLQRQAAKAGKAKAEALERMTEVQMRAALPAAPPSPTPSTPVVQPTFGAKKPRPAQPELDVEALLAGHETLRHAADAAKYGTG